MLSALDNCALQETTDAHEFALPKKLGGLKMLSTMTFK